MKIAEKVRKPGRSILLEEPEDNGQEEEQMVAGTEGSEISNTDTKGRLKLLLKIIKAVNGGDFSVRLPIEKDGVIGEISEAFNKVIILNENLANEIIRTSKVVGEEGKLTERVSLSECSGTWRTEVDSMNSMINNLAQPTIEVARVITAVAKGDLSEKMTLELEGRPIKGEFLRIGNTVNDMVDQLNSFAAEVTRVAKEVGTEGKLGGQAEVKGVGGTWKDLTDNVNAMASNLTSQVRNIAEVTTAVAQGDLSRKITVEAMGEILELKSTINTMVDQLGAFASEVTRVTREVGTEGKLGGQAEVKGVGGTWKDLTDNVNMLAGNLTSQVRNIAEVTTAVAQGDLSRKITVEAMGEILELKNTINTMVDQLNSFAAEVTRVAREVGTEGKLGGQAEVKGVGGTWKDLTDNVNMLAGNLTSQVRNIAEVTTAVAQGDLSRKITVEAMGEIAQLKNTINTMVDQLGAFASEVTRVAREVGTEGQLGGQAEVTGVAGTWKDLTDNVNAMASNLTSQVRNIAEVTTAVAQGDLSRKITVEAMGEILQLKDTINTMVDQLGAFAAEVTRVAREVGIEGQLGGQAEVTGVAGTWKDLTDNVNAMAANLTNQVRDIAEVTTAVAQGDLTRKITVEAMGEILELKNTINTMVDQLSTFAAEVTRVAREVGTEGMLGGQAEILGVAGVWQELTASVNTLAGNLTNQVREIANVTTAIAKGDLSQKVTVEVRGEILELKNTINEMVDNLSVVIGDVNSVMTMVGEGNLTRLIEAEAAGEFASMVNGINGTLESLRGIVTELTEAGTNIGAISQNMLSAGQEMNAMVTQLSSSVGQIAEGANTQAQQITEASRESEGVGETASNTATRADNMRQMSEAANKAATEGSKAMEETTKNTDLMLEGSKESVERINSLSKSTEQIREVIDIIRDIATQTNILAINAAIEAVRAGRQGRGFAVVAEEVKTLSADSKNQAKNISDLVQSILKETEGTVTTINTMAENVETGRRSTEQTSEALSEINRSVGETTKEAQEISVAAGQQKNSIDTVSQSLDKISGIAADTSTSGAQLVESTKTLSSSMQELAATSQTLAEMSERFRQTVGRFDIGEVVSAELAPAVAPRKARSAAKRKAKTPDKAQS